MSQTSASSQLPSESYSTYNASETTLIGKGAPSSKPIILETTPKTSLKSKLKEKLGLGQSSSSSSHQVGPKVYPADPNKNWEARAMARM